ncbi:MAG: 5-formyltetrahydrofolate cyclo-ligase [Parachlamydiales bacterium]|jgi:5-formyltetrahydrofolate cyclo-ligase
MSKASRKIQADKNTLREHFRSLRRQLLPPRREEAAQKAFKLLYSLSLPKEKPVILSFASKKEEIDLWPLNLKLLKEGRLALTKVVGKNLAAYLVTDLADLKLNPKWQILEPNPKKAVRLDLKKIRLALIPGLAFDRNGHRLGYGLGYFDRFLKQLAAAYTVGIGFKEQFSRKPLPAKSHDLQLKTILLF